MAHFLQVRGGRMGFWAADVRDAKVREGLNLAQTLVNNSEHAGSPIHAAVILLGSDRHPIGEPIERWLSVIRGTRATADQNPAPAAAAHLLATLKENLGKPPSKPPKQDVAYHTTDKDPMVMVVVGGPGVPIDFSRYVAELIALSIIILLHQGPEE